MDVENEFLFIEEIKSHPELYNASHVNYANKNIRNKLWVEITEKFELDVNAKHKWKDIRDRYVREKKKEKMRSKPRSSLYPPWECIPKLQWLDGHLRNYTFATRAPREPSKKRKYKRKTNNKKKPTSTGDNADSIDIDYEIVNDNVNKDDNKFESTLTSAENEVYDIKTEEVDPFKIKIAMENKCGQLYIENEKLIFVCDFCESIFYESNIFTDHILNFHKYLNDIKNDESILSLEWQDEIEFLDINSNDDIEEYIDYSPNKKITKLEKSDESYDDTQSFKNNDYSNIEDDSIDSKKNNENVDEIDCKSNNLDSDFENENTEINIFNLKRPQKIKNANGEYSCPMCDKKYILYNSLTLHFRNLHANINKCDHCGEIFQSAISLKTHLRKIHRVFKPKIGQEEIISDMKKQLGKNEIPLVPPPIRNDDDRFICLICKNSYSRHETLRKHHIKVHLKGEQPKYSCQYCDKPFQTEYSLKIHKATHDDNKRLYKCTKCDADFVHPKFLGVHLRTHLGNRKYPCEYCKEAFPKRIDKILHERSKHTKEKPYQCEDCYESFVKYSELVVHRNRKHNPHRKQPTHVCNYCNKIFHRKDTYNNHLHRHEGLRPFQCTICMARFVSSSTLRSHKKIHKRNSL